MTMNPIFTIWFFIIPGIVTAFALMFGNFSEHIFVHPDIATMPQNLKSYQYNCALSMQMMSDGYNQTSFNNGYHVTHHINSRIHWHDMPSHFMNNLEKYAENNAVVFQGIDVFGIGFNVFIGRWDLLADWVIVFTR